MKKNGFSESHLGSINAFIKLREQEVENERNYDVQYSESMYGEKCQGLRFMLTAKREIENRSIFKLIITKTKREPIFTDRQLKMQDQMKCSGDWESIEHMSMEYTKTVMEDDEPGYTTTIECWRKP